MTIAYRPVDAAEPGQVDPGGVQPSAAEPGEPGSRAATLRVLRAPAAVDLVAAESAAAALLTALGVDVSTESLRGTPGRMARAYAEMFAPQPFDLTTFPNDEGYDELVLARTAEFMRQGARGIVYGRNIIHHPDPCAMTQALMAIVHGE